MQNIRREQLLGPGTSNDGVDYSNAAIKIRGKKKTKKRSSLLTPQQKSSSNLVKNRRKSVPNEWDGCNFRVDTTRAHYQTTEINMPEIHHGIATSSIPIPLNTIMKSWNIIPKLHQYKPSQLQVVYHRRTGETETIVQPEPVKPPTGNHFQPLNQATPSSSTKCPDLNKTYNDDALSSNTPRIQQDDGDDNELPEIEPTRVTPILLPHSPKIIEEIKQEEFQNRGISPISQYKTTNNDCETQTSFSGGAMLDKNYFNQYQCRASQTEPYFNLSNISSQLMSIAAQTDDNDHTFIIEPKKLSICNKAVETEKINSSIAAVQVDFLEVTIKNECGSQTEVEAPQICLMCNFKQLQIEEIEENMMELQERFKAMQKTGTSESDLYKNQKYFDDASTNTDDELPLLLLPSTNTVPQDEHQQSVENEENDKKYIQLDQENQQLKATIQTLTNQLNSFQTGLKRLRTAIEKPIIEDTSVSEQAIQDVLHKADDFIINCSNSQTRALKINDHLSVLNTCITVANGIMKETTPK